MNITEDQFRKTLGILPTGVTVVTTSSDSGGDVGVTISSFTSLSLNPPQVLFCLMKQSRVWTVFNEAPSFAVNILSERQSQVADLFAKRDPIDWKNINIVRHSSSGCILLTDALGHVICEKGQVYDGNDHYIVIGKVVDLISNPHSSPLIRQRGEYLTTRPQATGKLKYVSG